MIVAELIAILEECDQNVEVMTNPQNGGVRVRVTNVKMASSAYTACHDGKGFEFIPAVILE